MLGSRVNKLPLVQRQVSAKLPRKGCTARAKARRTAWQATLRRASNITGS